MTGGAAFRGQPLLLLAALLLGWTGLRVALWQGPLEEWAEPRRRLAASPQRFAAEATPLRNAEVPAGGAVQTQSVARAAQPGEWRAEELPEPLLPTLWSAAFRQSDPVLASASQIPTPRTPVRAVIGHNLLLAAGLAQMEVPAVLLAYLQTPNPAGPGVPAAAPALAAAAAAGPTSAAGASRWSADGWLLLRRDATTPIVAGSPSYGRSQVGAVLRYDLALASPLRPQAYLRTSAALAGAREREVAAGLSARPIAALPVRVAAEARVSDTARGTEVRPAAYAVTEFPPLRLPLGVRGEAYAQAGYVGGDYATAFVDGQARIERTVAKFGTSEVSAGAGAWGGAQKGAARLDIGPSAAVTFRLGEARGRVAADYRFRVAGDAEPSSGPALTVSAGF